jgi:hypothetical protein
MEAGMTRAEEVAQRALAFVAASRAARERDLEWRKQAFGRIQNATPLPAYILKKHGGLQLSLKLDS